MIRRIPMEFDGNSDGRYPSDVLWSTGRIAGAKFSDGISDGKFRQFVCIKEKKLNHHINHDINKSNNDQI